MAFKFHILTKRTNISKNGKQNDITNVIRLLYQSSNFARNEFFFKKIDFSTFQNNEQCFGSLTNIIIIWIKFEVFFFFQASNNFEE